MKCHVYNLHVYCFVACYIDVQKLFKTMDCILLPMRLDHYSLDLTAAMCFLSQKYLPLTRRNQINRNRGFVSWGDTAHAAFQKTLFDLSGSSLSHRSRSASWGKEQKHLSPASEIFWNLKTIRNHYQTPSPMLFWPGSAWLKRTGRRRSLLNCANSILSMWIKHQKKICGSKHIKTFQNLLMAHSSRL